MVSFTVPTVWLFLALVAVGGVAWWLAWSRVCAYVQRRWLDEWLARRVLAGTDYTESDVQALVEAGRRDRR